MSNVVPFTGRTKLDLCPDRILDEAQLAELTTVVVVGYDPDGEPYLSSSTSDVAAITLLLERSKIDLLTGVYGALGR